MIVPQAIPALSALQAFGKIATQGVRASGFAYHELLVSLGICWSSELLRAVFIAALA
jgi:hypothetical protein